MSERNKTLGASEAAAVMGLSPWATPVDVWARKTGKAPEQAETAPMHWGLKLESVIAHEFEELHGIVLSEPQRKYTHDDGVLSATIDYRIDSDTLLEIKTTSAFSGDWTEVPVWYQIQARQQMLCTGAKSVVIALLKGGNQYSEWRVDRPADDWFGEYAKRMNEWWTRHVVADVAPPPKTISDMTQLYPKAKSKIRDIDDNPELIEAIRYYRTLKEDLSDTKHEMEEQELLIKVAMGDCNELRYRDKRVVTWSDRKRRGSVDMKKLACAHGLTSEEIDSFRSPESSYRAFSVKELSDG